MSNLAFRNEFSRTMCQTNCRGTLKKVCKPKYIYVQYKRYRKANNLIVKQFTTIGFIVQNLSLTCRTQLFKSSSILATGFLTTGHRCGALSAFQKTYLHASRKDNVIAHVRRVPYSSSTTFCASSSRKSAACILRLSPSIKGGSIRTAVSLGCGAFNPV